MVEIVSQELVGASGHADLIKLTFRTFLVKKMIHGISFGGILEQGTHDLE